MESMGMFNNRWCTKLWLVHPGQDICVCLGVWKLEVVGRNGEIGIGGKPGLGYRSLLICC